MKFIILVLKRSEFYRQLATCGYHVCLVKLDIKEFTFFLKRAAKSTCIFDLPGTATDRKRDYVCENNAANGYVNFFSTILIL